MLAILTSRTGLIGMAIAAVLLLFGVQEVRLKMAQHAVAAERAEIEAAKADAKAREAEGRQISQKAQVDLSAERVRIVTITKTLREKVRTYVPAAADAQCVVSRGVVQLLNAGASGLPGPSGGPDQAPSGVPISALTDNVIGNYGVAFDWRAEAMKWRSWYVDQKAAWDRK